MLLIALVAIALVQADPFAEAVAPAALDARPKVIEKRVPGNFPIGAPLAAPPGTFRIEFVIERDGTVKNARAIGEVAGPHRPLADRAVLMLRLWKFSPGRAKDSAVRSLATLVVTYRGGRNETWLVEGVDDDFGANAETRSGGPAVVLPRVTKQPNPRYPPDVLKEKLEAWVGIQLVVLPDGRVGAARVISSTDSRFEAAALDAVRQWEFTPGTTDGHAAPFLLFAELQFRAG